MRKITSIKCIVCVCMITLLTNGCSKSGIISPLYSFTMECSETTNDPLIGNVTTVSSSVFLAHNRDEAEIFVAKSNIRFGSNFKQCHLKQ